MAPPAGTNLEGSLSHTSPRDLRLRLLALYLMFVIPVIIATLAFDRVAIPRLELEIKASELALARAIALETNTILDNSLQAVRALSEYPEVIAGDPAGMEAIFTVVQSARPDINLTYRLDAEGTMLYHFPSGPGTTVGQDFSARDYFQRAQATRSPLLSIGRISPTTQQAVATAVMPMYDGAGQFQGVVATNIKLQTFSHALARIAAEYSSQQGFSVAILDSDGQVIAHPDPLQLLQPYAELLPEITTAVLSGQVGNAIQLDADGIQRLYSFVPIPSVEWAVIINRPTASAFLIVRLIRSGILLSVSVFLIFGLIFWFSLSHQVIEPLEILARFSQRVGQGSTGMTLVDAFNPAETSLKQLGNDSSQPFQKTTGPGAHRQELADLVRRPDQIGHLSRSLERMETDIHARLAELATLLQTSAAVVSTLDQEVVLNRILEQVEKLLQVQTCAIVALDEGQGLFRARVSRGLSARYAQALAIDPQEPASVSLRAIRSGEAVQISDTEEDPSFRPFRPRARAEGYRSILAVPLLTQHTAPAALLVYRREPHIFTSQEINLLTNFANHATMAIENAALYARSDMRLQAQTRRLEALIQSLQEGLILEDLQGLVQYANRQMGSLLQLTQEDIIGAPSERLLERLFAKVVERQEGERQRTRSAVLEILHGDLQSSAPRTIELTVQPSGQLTRTLRLSVFTVTDSSGQLLGRGLLLRDVTQNRELDRMKSSLIATVSHELRTPLALIKGYASTLLADDVQWDTHAQHEFLEIISNETDQLSDLVQDLLDMSRIEAGNLTVSRSECHLHELVARASNRAYPGPGDRLQLDIQENLPAFSADPKRIEAVLRNLIENAAKYAPDHTPIRIEARIEGDKLVVRIRDQGPGIPIEKSQRVFETFYRIQDDLARTTPGAGLGLAICQGFIRAHGGDIWLEPQATGTCVAFSIPITLGTIRVSGSGEGLSFPGATD